MRGQTVRRVSRRAFPWIRWICLIQLGATVHAGEPEGAAADPARWTDPRGTSAGSHRSRALPVLDPVEEAWSFALPGATGAPPVHWDGMTYMLCRKGKRRLLLALDLHTGKLRAAKDLQPGPLGRLVVWDGLVVLRLADTQLAGYRVGGKSFRQRWKPTLRGRDGKKTSFGDPVVIEREIFVRQRSNLIKLRVGRPVQWVARGDFVGRPAVYGSFVFILGHAEQPGYHSSLHIYAYRRDSGALAAMSNVAWYAGTKLPRGRSLGEITISPTRIYVRAPAPLATKSGASPWYASVPCAVTKNRVVLGGQVGLHSFVVAPSVHPKGLLALEKEGVSRWLLWKGGRGMLVASSTGRPELFKRPLPATVLGDIVYFGTWAADIETGEILWKLPVRDPRFAAVPADELVLVVDGTTLRAFRRRAG